MGQSTRTPTLSQVRAVSTQREPTGRVIIVIVTERGERREEKRGEERREEKEMKRDRKKRERKKDREHERREGGKPIRV